MSVRNGGLVSVVVPAYNAAATIGETLQSVRAQTYPNIEIIVVSDGSTDETSDVVLRHAARDARVGLIQQPNGGVAAARNRGIAAANGALIAPVDADDLWHPDKIRRQVEALHAAGEQTALVYCWYALIDKRSRIRSLNHRPTDEGDVFVAMCSRNLVGNGSSPLMRRRAVLEACGYDSSLRTRNAQGCEDYKLYLSIAERHRVAVVRDHLTGYRRTRDNMSSDSLQMLRSRDLVIEEFARRHHHVDRHLHEGRRRFLKWLFINAIRDGRLADASRLASYFIEEDRSFALKTFAMAAPSLLRSSAAPYVRRLLRPHGSELVPLSAFPIGIADHDAIEPIDSFPTPAVAAPASENRA